MLKRIRAGTHRFIAAILDGQLEERSIRHLRISAGLGNAWAQTRLGVRYLNGEGVSFDSHKAHEFFMMAAQQEFVEAYLNLAWMYYEGTGIRRDYEQALSWYHKAMKGGSSIASYNLALMYAEGEGVSVRLECAEKLLERASADGVAQAREALKNLRSRIGK